MCEKKQGFLFGEGSKWKKSQTVYYFLPVTTVFVVDSILTLENTFLN